MKFLHFSFSSKKVIKFTLTIVLAMFVSKIMPIAFAFIFPLFAGHFILFSLDKQPLAFYCQLFKKAILGTLLGMLMANIALFSIPLFFVAFLSALFIISYLYHQGGDQLKALFYLIGIILLPVFALIDPSTWVDFSLSYVAQVAAALLLVLLINKLFPLFLEPTEQVEEVSKLKPVTELPDKAWLLALVNTLVTAPILAATLYFDLVLHFLFFAYTCLITLQPQFKQASKHAFEYFGANIIGGGLALLMLLVWVFFNTLAMNYYLNLLMIIFMGISLIALLAYKTPFISFASFVLTPFIIIIFSIGETWQHYIPPYSERVYMIGAAALYSFIMLWFSNKSYLWFKK